MAKSFIKCCLSGEISQNLVTLVDWLVPRGKPEKTHYHCMADLLFDWFRFN